MIAVREREPCVSNLLIFVKKSKKSVFLCEISWLLTIDKNFLNMFSYLTDSVLAKQHSHC